jgi:hypothetical protein
MTSNHNSDVYAGRAWELMSGSPAYFWPVWFQRREIPKRAATTKEENPSLRPVPALDRNLCLLVCGDCVRRFDSLFAM